MTTADLIRRVLRFILALVDRVYASFDGYGIHLLAAFVVIGALLPPLGLQSGFNMTTLTLMFVFAILALSWDLIGGQTGYPSFGNMAFFGVGAYTTAILVTDFGVAFSLSFVVAGLLAVTFAGLIGIIVLRLRGGYFAIATLGVLLAAQQISRNLEITGGASGKILLHGPSGQDFYYLFLVLLAVEIVLVYYLNTTRFGLVLNAIRDDEQKATAMGFNTTYYKTTAWMLAGLFTGFAGGAWSVFNTFVNPQTAYNPAWNVELIAMALLGGSGTIAGPVLGAFGLHALIVRVIDPYFAGWQLVVLGVVVMATVIALPKGLIGTLDERASAMEYYKHGGQAATSSDAGGDDSNSGGDAP